MFAIIDFRNTPASIELEIYTRHYLRLQFPGEKLKENAKLNSGSSLFLQSSMKRLNVALLRSRIKTKLLNNIIDKLQGKRGKRRRAQER